MRPPLNLFMFFLLTFSADAAFAPKKREPAFKRNQEAGSIDDAIASAAAAYCTEDGCSPPPLAFAPSTSNHQVPATTTKKNQEVDEDFAIGYGTGVVACVFSLAMGFALGYSS
mmetsp:Transcript_33858/g.48107  ORF Transcript_33858/g.48107 Transcript_33858/m.48107 type:complete len:113 (-) Transcript_33858:460-798(-)